MTDPSPMPSPEDSARQEASARQERTRWLDALREAGLAHHLDALAPLVRTAIAVHPREASGPDHRVGASRLGGTPDLPAELPWPADAGGPLPFIAQFDLAVLAAFDVDHLLPHRGLLAFFGAWGEDGDRGTVLHVREGRLAPRAAPAGVDTEVVQGVDFALRVELPPHTSRFVAIDAPTATHYAVDPHTREVAPLPPPAVSLHVADHVRYADVYNHARGTYGRGQHGLLGYGRAMEGALRPDEVLLLRLDADGTIEHPFHEAAVLYFLIDRAALARNDFSAARFWYGASI